jgi:hypothetical protein
MVYPVPAAAEPVSATLRTSFGVFPQIRSPLLRPIFRLSKLCQFRPNKRETGDEHCLIDHIPLEKSPGIIIGDELTQSAPIPEPFSGSGGLRVPVVEICKTRDAPPKILDQFLLPPAHRNGTTVAYSLLHRLQNFHLLPLILLGYGVSAILTDSI